MHAPEPPELDPMVELHDLFALHGPGDALVLAANSLKHLQPGMAILYFVDDDRRLVHLFPIVDGAAHLAELIWFTCSPDEPEVSGLFIITAGSGAVPTVGQDDELLWQELVLSASEGATTLFDWWIVAGTHSLSVAEFAPTPAQW